MSGKEIRQRTLSERYLRLYEGIKENRFEGQKVDLIESMKEIDLTRLTKNQVSFLDKLKIYPALGPHGIEEIKNILSRNLQNSIAMQKIREIHTRLEEGLEQVRLISDALKDCVCDDEEESKDEVLIRVIFLKEASISNVSDFKNWGDTWYLIGHGITLAHNATPQDIKIVGADKGSVILELLTKPEIAATVADIIHSVLETVAEVLNIKKLVSEARKFSLKIVALEENATDTDSKNIAESEKKKAVENIIKKQTEKLKLNKDSDGGKITALEKAITLLVEFIAKGGELDFVVPEEVSKKEDKTGEIFAQIREKTKDIRVLEENLKLLECKDTKEE